MREYFFKPPPPSEPRRRRVVQSLMVGIAGTVTGRLTHGQFVNDQPNAEAPLLGSSGKLRYRVGLRVVAEGGPCRDIYATLPVPTDWPEQRVRMVDEDISNDFRRIRFRDLPGAAKQLIVDIPDLPAGREARAILTYELERAAILAPTQTAGLRQPPRTDRSLRSFFGTSPYIESRHPKIVRLARQVTAGREGWEAVEAIYDTVRERVEYRNGELKGAARALADGWGDCEELTCLFIAMARATGVPARTVWVEGHCYPEFYLVDSSNNGHWYPCQAAGSRAFGSMPDRLPILQKGDNFRDPDRPGKSLRYMSEFIRGSAIGGGGSPRVIWIREAA